MDFDLRQLGWKAFQDLCAAIAAEVLQRPVQTFLPVRDKGRDAAFIGAWIGSPDRPEAKSTIQCKFTAKADARLTLSSLRSELSKVAALAKEGLAHDYVIMTNAGVTGESEAAICHAFQQAGAKVCRVFDGNWVMRQIMERPRLRMMAPRVYGLLNLSELITGPAYDQARAILAGMSRDLACFVPTASHQAAVSAIQEHGFVLLLGDPASGKSTIAATLALGALDGDCTGAVKISSPDQLHLWRPNERQFLWVDDAFGPTQYEPARIQQWDAELSRLRAAVQEGTKVVFTSRNYVWERARHQLKVSAFPLFSESQVVVDVQALSPDERAQILYNHVRGGGHPPEMRGRLKPYLAGLAEKPELTPEIARRLGDPFLMRGVAITRAGLDAFVEEPVEFLKEVILNLSDAGRAALALIFMHPAIGLPSPIAQSDALAVVCRINGASPADIGRELEAMNGSLTLLARGTEFDRWVFHHPTISDAYAAVVADSPEQVELYVAGAKLDRLLVEVVCGPMKPQGAKVRVPADLYPQLLDRLASRDLDAALKVFLATRCDAQFLKAFIQRRPNVLELTRQVGMDLNENSAIGVLAAFRRAGCLPEETRIEAIERIEEYTIEWMDVGVFVDLNVRSLLTDDEFSLLSARFQSEWIDNLQGSLRRWRYDYHSSDELDHFRGFKDSLQRVEGIFCSTDNAADFVKVHEEIDEIIFELELKEPDRREASRPVPVSSTPTAATNDIFDDVDA